VLDRPSIERAHLVGGVERLEPTHARRLSGS
jgi:hypothetical protein